MLPNLGEVAEQVLGPVLSEEGLAVDEYSSTSITYRDEKRVIELSYYPEDLHPWLNVVLSLVQSGGLLRVALWRLYSEAEAPPLGFDSVDALRQSLLTVRGEWLDRLIWPAFRDPDRFRHAAVAELDEVHRNYVGSQREERLAQARWAFKRGSFLEAAEKYAGILDLSAADKRRYVLAQRQSPKLF